ncbi:primosomal protein [Agrococcus terreus]|uniref:primosomal protein n=1 Tax=Agrococcus terreus TaxID=574649 RepID=UPI00384E9C66
MNERAGRDGDDRRRAPRDGQGRPHRDGPRRDGDRPQGDRKPLRPGDRGYRPEGQRPERDGERRSHGDRPQRDGERRPYGDRHQRDGDRRPQRDGERRPYGDRPQRDGDRRPQRDGERRPYGDRPQRDGDRRPQRDGERRPYGDRPQRDGDRRPQRDGERRPYGDRPQRDGDRRPQRDGDRRPQRDGERRPYGDRPQRDGERRPYGDRPQRDGDRRPQRDGDRRPYGDRPRRDDGAGYGRGDQRRRDSQRERNQGPDRDAARPGRDYEKRGTGSGESFKQVRDDDFVAPELPDDVVPEDLDIGARAQLKTLTKDNAEVVARHMAMAGQLIDEEPELAHQHALAASRRAGRIGVVRETLAITAYQLGDFALALRELRTYRRITGRDDQLPLMADCERGMGRPERALELARSIDPATLETPVRVELAIVKSGARLDLGQPEAALEELRIPELRKDKAFEWSPALFASFAGVLEELGRDDEAAEWFALADRAIDALEAAMAPGELESIQITSERIEQAAEDALEEGVALNGPGADDAEAEREPSIEDEVEELLAEAEAADAVDAETEGAAEPPHAPARRHPAPDVSDIDAIEDADPTTASIPVVDAPVHHEAPATDDQGTSSGAQGDALFGDDLLGDDSGDGGDSPDETGDASDDASGAER